MGRPTSSASPEFIPATPMADPFPVEGGSPAEKLIEDLKNSKAYYDKALIQALDTGIPVKKGEEWVSKPITEEKAKLLARNETRKAGFEEPEVIRWRLLALLGPHMYGRDTD